MLRIERRALTRSPRRSCAARTAGAAQDGFDAWYNWALPVRTDYGEVGLRGERKLTWRLD